MRDRVAWGVIGLGRIARTFARALAHSETGRLVAAGSRTAETARSFGREFRLDRCHGSYRDLIADPEVQAVYIATPHPFHAEPAILAAESGKHVLVEKPMAVNHPQAAAIVEAARRAGVFLAEAFMYRCHPQTARIAALLREGAIGEVRVIQATFSFQSDFDSASRAWNNGLAGGGILDVGCYPVSMARLVAGVAAGAGFADPVSVTGAGRLNDATGVDEHAVGALLFPGGTAATVATGVAVAQENVVRVFGSGGNLFVPNPWVHAREGGVTARLWLSRKGRRAPEEIVCDTPVTAFTAEADMAGRAILAGRSELPFPGMTWADSLGNMRTLDRWREAIGLVYEAEKAARPAAARSGP
jgi:predicted dehydrogenase